MRRRMKSAYYKRTSLAFVEPTPLRGGEVSTRGEKRFRVVDPCENIVTHASFVTRKEMVRAINGVKARCCGEALEQGACGKGGDELVITAVNQQHGGSYKGSVLKGLRHEVG